MVASSSFSAATTSLVLLATFVVLLAALTSPVAAKRGCSAFGHSCFGGHGKRSDQGSSEEMPPQPPVLPVDTLALPGGDFEALLPPRSGLVSSTYNGRTLAQAINSLSPAIRQWLASTYRRDNALD